MGQRTAPQEDELVSFEADATVEVDGEIPYHNVPVLIAGEHDFERRTRLRDASLEVVEATNRERLEILRTSLATLANEFGHSDYTAYNAEKKRIDYSLLRSRMENFSQTEETYAALMGRWVEETTGRRLGEIGSHHFSYISRVPYVSTFAGTGYSAPTKGLSRGWASTPRRRRTSTSTPNSGDQEPQGCCYAPDPPREVHLLIKPVGGLEDYMAFFHEAGHAQHFGNEDPALDYVERAVSTSYALTEIYSFLLEHLTQNRAWLTGVVGLPEDAGEVAYYAGLTALLGAGAAKLAYELDFFGTRWRKGATSDSTPRHSPPRRTSCTRPKTT